MPWLPENIIVKLNEVEAGWLMARLKLLDDKYPSAWPYVKRGPNEETIPTTMPLRLLEKIFDAFQESKKSR